MKFLTELSACCAMGALLLATPSHALLVQPMVVDMLSTGARSTGVITAVNDRRTPETVEVTVGKLKLDERGPPTTLPDAGDDFIVFPPRATIQPGKTQVFRVRWIGDPALAQTRLYMFSTSELPVADGKANAIQVLYSVKSLVTVSSPKLKADIAVSAVRRATGPAPGAAAGAQSAGDAGKVAPGVEITVDNTGPGIAYVSRFKLTLSTADGRWSTRIGQADVARAVGIGLSAPASKRVFFIPVDNLPATGDLRGVLDFAPAV